MFVVDMTVAKLLRWPATFMELAIFVGTLVRPIVGAADVLGEVAVASEVLFATGTLISARY
jgi:hypothetical protein